MTSIDDPPGAPARRPGSARAPRDPVQRRARLRLVVLVVGLVAFAAVFTIGGVVGTGTLRGWIAPAGALAPVAFVLGAGVLGAVLVPGAALAAASGVLFGPAAGTLLSLISSVLSAVLARELSARVGGEGLETVTGRRTRALVDRAQRNGLSAVIVQRLLPAVPDGPFSHAFGLAGVGRRDIALGTAIGSGPRALAYALLGSAVDDFTGPRAVAGLALWVATGALGLVLGALVVRRRTTTTH